VLLLKGSVPLPITAEPAVIVIYVLLILIVGSALASILLRNVLFAIASFSATMVGVALLYLLLAPFLLFAVQLLIFTTISAGLLLALVRSTSGLESPPESPFSPELISGSAVGAALLALLGVVVGATNWPVRIHGGPMVGLGGTLVNTYVVGIAVLVVILASAALGAGLLTMQRPARRATTVTTAAPGGRRRSGPREPRR
jgi:NADH:ubiquinone oxidoreductase subunit 6 (subunit J)